MEEVLSMHAVYIGPREVIVAAKIRPLPSLSASEIANAMDKLDASLRGASPVVADVYLDLTSNT